MELKPSKGKCMKIGNHNLKSAVISFYEEFKTTGLGLDEYFGINLVVAIETNRSNNPYDFNLRETIFDQSKKVLYDYYGK